MEAINDDGNIKFEPVQNVSTEGDSKEGNKGAVGGTGGAFSIDGFAEVIGAMHQSMKGQ